MSHFTVMVVLDEYSEDALEKALQPFHEYECTGTEDEYVIDLDETDRLKAEWSEEIWVKRKADGTLGMAYVAEGEDPNGAERMTREAFFSARDGYDFNAWVTDYEGLSFNSRGRVMRRTNPNAKWDWWVLGGRWRGMLVSKAAQVVHGSPSWTNAGEEVEGVDAAKWSDVENKDLVTFAILKDGHWAERGKMGWWACVSDANDNWEADSAKIRDTIRPEQWVAVVDCHI